MAVLLLLEPCAAFGQKLSPGFMGDTPLYASAQTKKKTTSKKKTTTKKRTTTRKTGRKTSTSKPKGNTTPSGSALPSTASGVNKEKQKTAAEIEKAQKQLDENARKTKRQLNELNSLEADIALTRKQIDTLHTSLDSLEHRLTAIGDTILATDSAVHLQQKEFAANLRKSRALRRRINPSTYILSSGTFLEAWKRSRYMTELEKWRAKETYRLKISLDTLNSRREREEQVKQQRNSKLQQISSVKGSLEGKQKQTKQIVANLKSEGASLKKVIAEKQKRMKDLDRALDRIIAEEARKAREAQERAEAEARRKEKERQQAMAKPGSPDSKTSAPEKTKPTSTPTTAPGVTGIAEENRRLTGGFEQNQGKLLFPVSGKYKIVGTFGTSKRADMPNVEVNNNGIDIEVSPGTKARAIFEGEVSAAFRVAGYDNVVMLRHGHYLSVYAGLSSIDVKKGQKVKAGQVLGSVATDASNADRALLHFEIRNERQKLNPLNWVR